MVEGYRTFGFGEMSTRQGRETLICNVSAMAILDAALRNSAA